MSNPQRTYLRCGLVRNIVGRSRLAPRYWYKFFVRFNTRPWGWKGQRKEALP